MAAKNVNAVLAHKAPKPLPQVPCLFGDLIELARLGASLDRIQRAARNKVRLPQPIQKTIAVRDPVYRLSLIHI